MKKYPSGAEVRFAYAGESVVNEFNEANQLLSRYDIGAGETLRAELGTEGERFYFSDALGSTTSLAAINGASGVGTIYNRQEYDAFGSVMASSGSGTANSIEYTGITARRRNELDGVGQRRASTSETVALHHFYAILLTKGKRLAGEICKSFSSKTNRGEMI